MQVSNRDSRGIGEAANGSRNPDRREPGEGGGQGTKKRGGDSETAESYKSAHTQHTQLTQQAKVHTEWHR